MTTGEFDELPTPASLYTDRNMAHFFDPSQAFPFQESTRFSDGAEMMIDFATHLRDTDKEESIIREKLILASIFATLAVAAAIRERPV